MVLGCLDVGDEGGPVLQVPRWGRLLTAGAFGPGCVPICSRPSVSGLCEVSGSEVIAFTATGVLAQMAQENECV